VTAPIREPIYAALFQLVSAIPGVTTASRRLKHWADVPPADQPALFQVQKGETVTDRRGLPPKRVLAVELFLYAQSGGDPGIAPAQILNPLIDAIEAALAPDGPPPAVQNLGGLVSHAWIEGRIETDEGVLGDQAVAIIPIHLLVP
jgi:hypothetical protein